MNTTTKMPAYALRIEHHLPKLSKAEKRIAQHVIQNASKVVHQTITELAEEAGTSETSVVRLCQKIGYRGFHEFKTQLSRDILPATYQIHEDIDDDDTIHTLKNKVMRASARAILDTQETLDDEQFAQAVAALQSARKIEIVGVGGSGAVALDAQHKFIKIGYECQFYLDGYMQAMSTALLEKGDVLVAISHTGTSGEVVDAAMIAQRAGATVISITHRAKSPLGRASNITLITSANETNVKLDALTSRLAQLAIIDALYSALALAAPEKAGESFRKTQDATTAKKY